MDMSFKMPFDEMIAAADAQVRSVSVKDVAGLLDDENTVIVDIRDVRELERDGMIPGAFHCPRGMLEFWIHPGSPYHKPIFSEAKTFIFYCASGWRSALSTRLVQQMGLERVAHIEGGFGAWSKSGGSVQTKAPRKQRSDDKS